MKGEGTTPREESGMQRGAFPGYRGAARRKVNDGTGETLLNRPKGQARSIRRSRKGRVFRRSPRGHSTDEGSDSKTLWREGVLLKVCSRMEGKD